MKPEVLYAWPMQSSHGSTTYEILLYVDGSTSCNCPGWVYHAKKTGERTCKHLRLLADEMAYVLAGGRPRRADTSPVEQMASVLQGKTPARPAELSAVPANAPRPGVRRIRLT